MCTRLHTHFDRNSINLTNLNNFFWSWAISQDEEGILDQCTFCETDFTSFGIHWPLSQLRWSMQEDLSVPTLKNHIVSDHLPQLSLSTWCQASFSLLFLKSYLCTWYLWYYTCNWNRVIQHSMIYLLLYILLKYKIEMFEYLSLAQQGRGYAPTYESRRGKF